MVEQACLRFVAKPTLALAAKNWAVMLLASPIAASAIRIRKPRMIRLLLPVPTPLLRISATTMGTRRSKKPPAF